MKYLEFVFFSSFFLKHSYIRRRDLHTVLPKHAMATSNQSPRLLKTNSVDEKSETNMISHLKRPKLDSTSSDSGTILDSDVEIKTKHPKLEQIDEINTESSPKTSELNLATTE